MAAPFEILRMILGTVYVLFVPGLAWSFVVFARTKPFGAAQDTPGIDWLERSALSVGLSIAIVPLAVFFVSTFARVPITTPSAIVIVLLLTLVPAAIVGYRIRRRRTEQDPSPASPQAEPLLKQA